MPPDYSHSCLANICALCYKSNSCQSLTRSYFLANLYSLFTYLKYLKLINYEVSMSLKADWVCQHDYVYICTYTSYFQKLLLIYLKKNIFSYAGADPHLGSGNCKLIPIESKFLASIPGHHCKTAKSSKGTHPALWWNFGKTFFLPKWHDTESAKRVTLSPGN